MKKIALFFTGFLSLLMISCSGEKKLISTVEHPEWIKNAVIYEVNTRQFSVDGKFASVEKELPRLKSLGVDVLWFMPITPIGIEARKGSLGSYYSVKDYKAVNPEFGTIDDFKSLVAKAHELGMKVIIDWVANHTSRDAAWINNKEWYVMDSTGTNPVAPFDWTDVAKLNYDNKEMRSAMKEAMIFWIKEANIDGFRCDVAEHVPVDFWEDAFSEIKKVKNDVFMLAEAENPELQKNTFNAYYAWHLHHIMNNIAQGKATADTLRKYFTESVKRFPSNTIPFNFTSNHDENSWKGSEHERMGGYAKQMAVFTYVAPGIPLIYNGQEAGFNRRLLFFEKDSIDWKRDTSYTKLYQELYKLRKENPVLNAPDNYNFEEINTDKPSSAYVMQRKSGSNSVISIFNFSTDTLTIKVEKGLEAGTYNSFMDTTTVQLTNSGEFKLLPRDYKIYFKK